MRTVINITGSDGPTGGYLLQSAQHNALIASKLTDNIIPVQINTVFARPDLRRDTIRCVSPRIFTIAARRFRAIFTLKAAPGAESE